MSVRDANLRVAAFQDADAAYRRKLGDDAHHMFCSGGGAPCSICGRWRTQDASLGASPIAALKLRQDDRAYYGRKWGGLPGYEQFTRPFNDKKNAVGASPDVRPLAPSHSKPFGVCLYGNFGSNGSFGRVSRGLEEGLRDLGLLSKLVEVDTPDPSELEEGVGADATIGIYAGAPSRVGVMTSYGAHRLNFAILAPNSSWLPDKLVRDMLQRACLVAPSSWGASVLANYTGESIAPLTHGVSKDFAPIHGLHVELDKQYAAEDGVFRAAHFTSTTKQRKATREVITAWRGLVVGGAFGKKTAELHVIADAPDGSFGEPGGGVLFHGPSNATIGKMREIYQQFHVVVQPSRAEGFGMVPLEARACGVPVVATTCTGHADHMGGLYDGYVFVVSGEHASIDDGPGAMAPTVSADSIAASISLAFDHWSDLHAAALAKAAVVRHEWAWSHRLALWINATGVRNL